MSRYSLQQFLDSTSQRARGQGTFELENERMLEVNLDGTILIKTGAMVSYAGSIRFEREGMMEKGLGKFLKVAVTGEGARLTKAQGQGRMYLADRGKSIQLLQLEGQSLFVNGNDLLAFEPTIEWDISLVRKLSAVVAGGLFNVKLSGRGTVAISTHFQPLTLRVEAGHPIRTDPHATVAWSGSLTPEFIADVSFKTFLGRGGGESIQMEFQGDGFVVIQPYEELSFQAQ